MVFVHWSVQNKWEDFYFCYTDTYISKFSITFIFIKLQVAHSKFETSTEMLLLFLSHNLSCSIHCIFSPTSPPIITEKTLLREDSA